LNNTIKACESAPFFVKNRTLFVLGTSLFVVQTFEFVFGKRLKKPE